jgi:succinoglycan biosynthesis protein ExoO
MEQTRLSGHKEALISVVMANYQAGDKIVTALQSVLRQSHANLEVIVSDDASQDHSIGLVRTMMASDPRIRLLTSETNQGPARCRNRALDAANGDWIAIVDSDDLIHPERLERLLGAAAQLGADIVADDMILFHEDGAPPRLMLGQGNDNSFVVSPEQWVLAGIDGSPALGYLKPLIRRSTLAATRYDENLRIGEDYDFVLRLLMGGASMAVVPEPYYLYRRHSGSISHRLSVRDMRAMVDRQVALVSSSGRLAPPLLRAFNRRLAILRQGLAYEELVASIKARNVGGSVIRLLRHPSNFGRLAGSFLEGYRRRDGARQRTYRKHVGPLVLGAEGRLGVDRAVPNYMPPHLVDWRQPRPRECWRALAAFAGANCIPLDAAGRFASGFVPDAIVEEGQLVREAS